MAYLTDFVNNSVTQNNVNFEYPPSSFLQRIEEQALRVLPDIDRVEALFSYVIEKNMRGGFTTIPNRLKTFFICN